MTPWTASQTRTTAGPSGPSAVRREESRSDNDGDDNDGDDDDGDGVDVAAGDTTDARVRAAAPFARRNAIDHAHGRGAPGLASASIAVRVTTNRTAAADGTSNSSGGRASTTNAWPASAATCNRRLAAMVNPRPSATTAATARQRNARSSAHSRAPRSDFTASDATRPRAPATSSGIATNNERASSRAPLGPARTSARPYGHTRRPIQSTGPVRPDP